MNDIKSKENRGQHFKYQVDSSPSIQRKFGGTVNRNTPKLSQSPIKELDNFMIDPEQKRHTNHREANIRTRNQEYKKSEEEHVVNQNRETNKTPHKQEISKRRRDFDMRVNNIQKMSEQMTGLLDYVKQSQDRVAASSLLKTNSKTKISVSQNRYAVKLSQIRSSNKPNDKQHQQQQQNQHKHPYQNQHKHQYQRSQNMMEIREKPDFEEDYQVKQYENKYSAKYLVEQALPTKLIFHEDYGMVKSKILQQKHPATAKNIDRSYNIDKSYIEASQKYTQPQKQPLTPSKNKYHYAYEELEKYDSENKPSKTEFSKQQYPKEQYFKGTGYTQQRRRRNLQQKDNHNNNQDQMYQEIVRIRSKIHSSEKRTLEMEKKYLNPSLNHQKELLHQYSEKVNQNKDHTDFNRRQKSIGKKYFDYSNHLDKYYKQENVLSVSKNSEAVSQFKINVHPITIQEASKSKVNRNITSRPLGNDYIQEFERSARDSLDHQIKSISEKIASILSQQVNIDKKLRNARGNFDEIKDRKKWNQLKKQLSARGYSYTEQELERELSIKPNQFDPFSSQEKKSGDKVQDLADCFIKSQKFWEQNVTGIVTKKQIDKYRFSVDQIDLNAKGYINVEDLVCFINLQTNGFFRNRDVLTLYRRFMALTTERQGIDKKCFINKIVR